MVVRYSNVYRNNRFDSTLPLENFLPTGVAHITPTPTSMAFGGRKLSDKDERSHYERNSASWEKAGCCACISLFPDVLASRRLYPSSRASSPQLGVATDYLICNISSLRISHIYDMDKYMFASFNLSSYN